MKSTPDKHDLEHPGIPSIPEEEEEEEELNFQLDFPEFSPGGDTHTNHGFSPILEEKSDASDPVGSSDILWKGILRKSQSTVNLNG